jgi:hypothetical protein
MGTGYNEGEFDFTSFWFRLEPLISVYYVVVECDRFLPIFDVMGY